MTMSEKSQECKIPGCTVDVNTFTDPFPVPPKIAREIAEVPRGEDAQAPAHHVVMCDSHNAAARILAYTRSAPPYVDIGLYQEVTYYSRSLAAEFFGLDSSEMVTTPQDAEEDTDAE